MAKSLFFCIIFGKKIIMDEKLVKKMIYMTVILFIFVFVSFIFAKKSTADLKKEQMLEEKQMQEQEEKYNRYNRQTNNESYEQNQTNGNQPQYIDENANNINQPSDNNYSEITPQSNSEVTENKPVDQKDVEITKLTDEYLQKGYSIVKDFQINSTKFAIISKTTDYQSEYSKTVNKKYYIYKYIGQNLYETAYIIDSAIPKDKENQENEFFTINTNGTSIEININSSTKTSRTYNKQNLLTTPLTGVKVLKTETVTESPSI